MADIREPNSLGIARLEEKRVEMQLSLARSRRQVLEMEHEMQKTKENAAITAKNLAELEAQIKGIPKEG